MKTFTLAAATLVAGMNFALAQSATHEPAGTHGTVGAHAGVFSSEHGSMIRQHATSQRYQSHQEPGFTHRCESWAGAGPAVRRGCAEWRRCDRKTQIPDWRLPTLRPLAYG